MTHWETISKNETEQAQHQDDHSRLMTPKAMDDS